MEEDALKVVAAGDVLISAWEAENPGKLGTRCANCATIIEGPYCRACGQKAEDFDRTVGALTIEAAESLLHADGRLQQTLPRLITKPAQLTQDYLTGRRASQTPPLRMFLVVVLLFFFVGSVKGLIEPEQPWYQKSSSTEAIPAIPVGPGPASRAFAGWFNPRIQSAIAHQHDFGRDVEHQFHKIAIVFLPIVTLILGLVFIIGKKRYFLFDHAVFAMHSLSFMGLLFSGLTLLAITPIGRIAVLFAIAAPIHLFVHFRGVYRTSVFGTCIRLMVLLMLSAIAAAFLLVATVGVELNGLAVTPL